MLTEKVEEVKDFWEDHLCGSHFVKDPYLSEEFYQHYTDFRYLKEHHLLHIIDWEGAKGKDVLEIGLGVGADAVKWATHAKSYTGIDLTNEAAMATQKHLDIKGLNGKAMQGNAEAMPFNAEQFDLVYSHGVLHHTENIENTFKEIQRVLKPGGEFIIMLYTKDSFNYWVRIQSYFRIRFLVEWMKQKIGLKSNENWSLHLKEWRRMGWKYWSWNEFPHHCTDGPECSIANIYYPSEIIKKLAKYHLNVDSNVKTHFPIFGLGKSEKLEFQLAKRLGFFRFYFGKKEK
jgi:ubiquinone/menaquinone biosynthesis C-methylase UbiE